MRKWAIGIAVAVALLLVLDRVAVMVVTSVIDDRIEKKLAAEVGTSLGGFPFLPSAIGRTLPQVSITAEEVRLGRTGFTVRSLDVDADDVDVHDTGNPVASTFTATAVMSYAEAERIGGLTQGTLTSAPDGQVRYSRTVPLQNSSRPVTVTGPPRLDGDIVTLDARRVELGGAVIEPDAALQQEIRELFQLRLPTDELPEGTSLEELTAGPDGLGLRLTGTDVALNEL